MFTIIAYLIREVSDFFLSLFFLPTHIPKYVKFCLFFFKKNLLAFGLLNCVDKMFKTSVKRIFFIVYEHAHCLLSRYLIFIYWGPISYIFYQLIFKHLWGGSMIKVILWQRGDGMGGGGGGLSKYNFSWQKKLGRGMGGSRRHQIWKTSF